MEQWSAVNESGNSNVMVYVDTTAIAYALIICLSISENMESEDIQNTLNQFQYLLEKDETRKHIGAENDTYTPQTYRETPNKYAVPVKTFYKRR